jgi:hypothetical protein
VGSFRAIVKQKRELENRLYKIEGYMSTPFECHRNFKEYRRSDDKVRELATMCLPWHEWTETAASLDAVDISA